MSGETLAHCFCPLPALLTRNVFPCGSDILVRQSPSSSRCLAVVRGRVNEPHTLASPSGAGIQHFVTMGQLGLSFVGIRQQALARASPFRGDT